MEEGEDTAEIKFTSKEHDFDFEQDRIKAGGLREGWQTGGTVRITRLEFNHTRLYKRMTTKPGEDSANRRRMETGWQKKS